MLYLEDVTTSTGFWDTVITFLETNLSKILGVVIVILVIALLLSLNNHWLKRTVNKVGSLDAKTEKKLEKIEKAKKKANKTGNERMEAIAAEQEVTRGKRQVLTVSRLIHSLIKSAIVIVGAFVILYVCGLNVMPALAGAGIVGIVVGLGAQALIGDLLAGIAIVMDEYYDVDDVIEVNGFKGKVISISLRSTKIKNWRGEVRVVTNGTITAVTNFSRNLTTDVVTIPVSYDENIDQVASILKEHLPEVAAKFPKDQILEGPAYDGVGALADGVVLRIKFTTRSEEQYAVERELNKFLKELFDAHGIEIPWNQLVIHTAPDSQMTVKEGKDKDDHQDGLA